MHLDEPIRDAFLVEAVQTFWVAGPNDRFTNFIRSQTNGAAVGDNAVQAGS